MSLAHFSLNHLGIFVIDIEKMTNFYTGFFGFVVTDERLDPNPIRFMTMTPTEHHQLVLASGRDPKGPSTVHQISFLVDDFAAIRRIRDAALAHPDVTSVNALDHGNSWALYFKDPEGNTIECYVHTPWHISQPYGKPIDFDRSDAEIWAKTEADVLANPSYLPAETFQADLERRLAEARA